MVIPGRFRPDDEGLSPYVSDLQATWLAREPERTWQAIDGSLVFADVSGFTPLAEKLAKHGKVGAEELTDTLNDVFRSLLDVARGFGGDCLKFGGDALLLLFTGEAHVRAAAAAAHGMLATLHGMRRRGSSAGLATLDMSVGVHTGAVHAFLVGGSHRELLLAGPTVSGTLGLESLAEAGEILVSEDVAAHLAGGDVDETARAGLLLRRPPMVTVTMPRPLTSDERVAAALGVPASVRAHLDGTHLDGEHRPSTISFLKFGGTDQLVVNDGPEALEERFAELVERTQEAAETHGVTFLGSDVDRDGGKLLLAAGTPVASPDDEDRMLLAMRDVIDGCRALPLRAGVNRGRIFAVDLGSVERRAFTVMGDAVNLAARVMANAKWGEVVATDEVLERRRTDFELVALAPFTVKGKSEPISAQVVGRARGKLDEAAPPSVPLIGRTSEMATIRDGLARAHEGRGTIIELVGEPGIGKSRLVRAVESLDHQLSRFAFEAGRYSLATPYFAVQRGMRYAMGLAPTSPTPDVEAALRAVVADVAPDLQQWLPLLGIPLGLELPDTPATASLDPTNRQSRLQAVVVDLMQRVLVSPTLITIEDSHWLDSASSELIAALLEDVDRRPWAVVVTRRDVDGGLELPESRSLTSIKLQPLGDELAVSLARATTGAVDLPPGVVDDLVARSGGNPLFLQELLVAAMRGSLDEIPDSVEAVVATNIDTLPVSDRSVLRHAAVLGGQFPLKVLAPMLGVDESHARDDVKRLSHFLTPEANGVVRFRHILLRDVAYEGLAFRTRRSLHDRAGTILELSTATPESLAELLSIHFDRAGRHRESWRYSRLAGERAQRNGAPVEAAAFYGRALDAARRLGDIAAMPQADVAENLGDAWELAGRYEQASRAYASARSLARRDHLRRGRLCRKMGLVREHEGKFAAAQRWFARGVNELAPLASLPEAYGLRAELTNAAVTSRLRQGRVSRAEPQLVRAISDATAAGNDEALARAYCVLDQVLFAQGRYAEATYSDTAASIYEQLGNHRGAAEAYNEKGTRSYWLGRWDQAVADYERAMDHNRLAGGLVHVAINLNNIGEIRSDQGRLDEASELLEQARVLWAGAGWRDAAFWAVSNLGRVASRAGRDGEAAQRLSEAIEVFIELRVEPLLLQTEAREVERLVLAGRHDAALELIDEMTPRVERAAQASVALMLDRLAGYALAQAGDPERGADRLEASLSACRSSGAEYEAALALEGLSRVAPLVGRGDAAELAAEAQATFDRLGVVLTPTFPLHPIEPSR